MGLFFATMDRAARKCIREFSAQNFVNMAWACATANRLDELLFAAIARAAASCIADFNAQDLANMVRAAAVFYVETCRLRCAPSVYID